jgi:hypothetical protein
VNALFQISKTDFAEHTIAVVFASSSCRHSAVLLPTLSSIALRLHRPNLAFFSVNVNRLNSYTLPSPTAPPSDIEERATQQAIFGPVNALEESAQSKHAGLFSSMLVVRATPTLLLIRKGRPVGFLEGPSGCHAILQLLISGGGLNESDVDPSVICNSTSDLFTELDASFPKSPLFIVALGVLSFVISLDVVVRLFP